MIKLIWKLTLEFSNLLNDSNHFKQISAVGQTKIISLMHKNNFTGHTIVAWHLCTSDANGPLICPPPCACSSDFSDRNPHAWPCSAGTLDEREITKSVTDIIGHTGLCVRLWASAQDRHLCEDSTLLHRRCLTSRCCHDLQMEWKASASQQSEEI